MRTHIVLEAENMRYTVTIDIPSWLVSKQEINCYVDGYGDALAAERNQKHISYLDVILK